jgi:hypothetical protein
VKISLPLNDQASGVAPPSSIKVTPTDPPLSATSCSMDAVSVIGLRATSSFTANTI